MAKTYAYTIYIEPLEPLSFKWTGEYTPVATGPQAYASSEPLPLPTTITGTLLALLRQGPPPRDRDRLSVQDVEVLLVEEFNKRNCTKPELRGPYYLVQNSNILLHLYSRSLAKIKSTKPVIEHIDPSITILRGVGLKRHKKKPAKHLLYTLELTTIKKLLDAKIAVDIYCSSQTKEPLLERSILVRIGTEGRLAKISTGRRKARLETVAEIQKPKYIYIASPLILNEYQTENLLELKEVKVNDVKLKPPSIHCLQKDLGLEKNVKRHRPRVTLLALGYDTIRNSLREIYSAIMPGSILEIVEGAEKLDKVVGLGLYRSLGWGTALLL